MKGKKALCYDSGLFIHMSQELAKQFDKVYYYNHWQGDGFPMPNDYYMGVGFEFEKIWDFWKYVDKVDVIIFPDILCGDMQVFLRKKGYNVWGSGMGEELEIYRAESKELLKEIGLPVNKYEVIEGFESLKDFLKNKEDKYIKINSNIRGLKETFHYDDYKLSQPLFNEIKAKITGYEDMIEFVVEDPIDSVVEPGTDTYCINGDYPDKMLFAYEIKNEAYIGKVTSKTIYPKPLKNTLEKLSPIMKKYNYRGFFSTEEKVTKDRKSYLIDTTARLGMPSGGSQMGVISNWGEIIYNGAQGKLVQPEFRAKYVAELMMECDYSKDHQNAIHYPEKISDLIKMGYCMKKDGIVYTLPKYTNCIGTITVTGNTPQEIKDKMEDAKEQVHGYGLCIEMDHLECAFDAMKEGEKYL